MDMRVGRGAGWMLAGSVVSVAGGVATNRVEGPWWAQGAWFVAAVVPAVVGQWVTRRTPERGRPGASVTGLPVVVQVSAAVSDEARQGEGAPVVVGELPREPVGFQPRPELMARLEEEVFTAGKRHLLRPYMNKSSASRLHSRTSDPVFHAGWPNPVARARPPTGIADGLLQQPAT
ncbi:hypothetical protein GCM10017673_09760 [Streptosporangium violaceochromogenes]|nr:hypothetical protein GCM10017673_09760 [Streptosporangium violaceochromogenes]